MSPNYDKNPLSHPTPGELEKPPVDSYANHTAGAPAGPFGAGEIRALGRMAAALAILAIVLIVLATIKW